MSDLTHLTTKRPRGLVPGTVEWLREIEGPRLVKRLLDEVHAKPVGEMTPTGARCASMLLDRALPTLATVHHTVEGSLSRMTDDELRQELRRLTEQQGNTITVQAREVLESTEQRATVTAGPRGSLGEDAE
jgi:hypothetical protein